MRSHSDNAEYDAKRAYQDSTEAESYDARRFSTIGGKIGDALDKRAIAHLLTGLQRLQPTPLRLLDIPCGTGRITRFLLEKGYHVSGADISQQMMDVAQMKMGRIENFGGFYQQDASKLDFEDDSFDCVVCVRFIGHIPGDVRIDILREFHRVSKFVIIEHSIESRTVRLRRQIDHYLRTGSILPKRWAWHIFRKSEFDEELMKAGFQPVNIQAKLPYLSDSYYVLARRSDSRQ